MALAARPDAGQRGKQRGGIGKRDDELYRAKWTPNGSTLGIGALYDDGSGHVGIGTTAPAQKLDVNGNLNFSNGTSSTIFYGTNGAAAPGSGCAGEKIRLYGTPGTVGITDFALGIQSNNMWFNTNSGFLWDIGGTTYMAMTTAAMSA